MRNMVVTLAISFWMGVWAQESVQEFRKGFSYILRVAEVPCPKELASGNAGAICYRHGYPDFFDFKEVITSLVSPGPDDYLEPWHVVTLQANETAEVFRARYRLSKKAITLTYVSERLLVLEVGDLRATP